ncbi:MAG: hypothetical protein KJ558_09750 [Gammaproteobacteria bacterium]|nr:hypothetical protein [Gammaproteobacteria bacterium]MBU1655088.1 hypothetical protein [Gammaproteobacteria bacterium]MBU1961560.1 hypothetical protein [Gammaproteobacteria bacterium]
MYLVKCHRNSQQQLNQELKSGGFKEMVRSLDRSDIGQMATQALSLINQEVVITRLQAARSLFDFGNRGEVLIEVAFNVEENGKILAADVRHLRFQQTLSDGWRFRGAATEAASFRAYLP